ncbi:MAG: glycine cleavage system aminomethyltransferase GcvT [Chthoniobacterales bacterium]|nr:glycine cleavage system aminomethyltransferase GcvT [Chthoniobacterales bacterium]
MKHSPLELPHQEANARMIEFAGWLMPVQYKGIREEHQAVREKVGMFDISHMGEIVVSGEGAAAWLESLLTNRLSKCAVGQGQYTLLLNEAGGVIDDLLIYRIQEKEFFLVINAGRHAEDVAWLQQQVPQDGTVHLEDKSDSFAAIAIQGPLAAEVLTKVFPMVPLPKRNGIVALENNGWIARTGYTGEDGFEIFLSHADGVILWKNCIAAGVTPCGLGARDTLRLDMGYPLNSADLLPSRTPLEAGLEKFLSLDDPLKPYFIGRAALEKQREAQLASRLTPLKLCKGVVAPPLRAHYSIYSGEQLLGETTSGALSPSLGEGIAMAYLPVAFTQPGTSLEVEIRGRRFPIEVAKLPFYKK